MTTRWKLALGLYSLTFAIVGGIATYQVVALNGDLGFLGTLWWFALPMTPILASVTVFLTVFLGYAWGNSVVAILIPLLCSLLFFIAGAIQVGALFGITTFFQKRKSIAIYK